MAPSRKSSSRKLSIRKSLSRKSLSRKSSSSISNDTEKKPNMMIPIILGIIFNILLIYYLNNLEDASCDCIIDWRHYLIKYLSIFTILSNIISLMFSVNLYSYNNNIAIIMIILGLINLYAFITYISDLNTTKCECAISKQKKLNNFFYIMRYIYIIILAIPIIFIIFVLLNKGFNSITN
jgi:hypothetical protein